VLRAFGVVPSDRHSVTSSGKAPRPREVPG
jgi:hypothetical protein